MLKIKETHYLTVILVVFIAIGCSEDKPGGEFIPQIAIVEGAIMTQDGGAVEGAQVTAYHRRNGCEGTSAEPSMATSNQNGGYEIEFVNASGRSDRSCFVVEVLPPDTNKYQTPEAEEINPEFREQPPFDTVTVNFELSSKN